MVQSFSWNESLNLSIELCVDAVKSGKKLCVSKLLANVLSNAALRLADAILIFVYAEIRNETKKKIPNYKIHIQR